MNLDTGLYLSHNALGMASVIGKGFNYCWSEWVKLGGKNISRSPKILGRVFKGELWKFLKY